MNIDDKLVEFAGKAGFFIDADGEYSHDLYMANMPKLRRFARLVASLPDQWLRDEYVALALEGSQEDDA